MAAGVGQSTARQDDGGRLVCDGRIVQANTDQATGDSERRTLSRVAWHPHPEAVDGGFNQTLALLFPTLWQAKGRRASVLKLFGHRVTWGAISHWRHGRRALPQWARELLIEAMETRVSELLKAVDALKKKPGG